MPLIRDRIVNGLVALGAGVLIVALVAGLTHFIAILILPDLASKDAYSVLSTRSVPNRMVLLPQPDVGDVAIPFRDPAAISGVCFFDVTTTPVRIRLTTEEGRLLTLSFRTPEGKIFYSMTDRAALHDKIDILLVNDAQLKIVEDNDDEDAGLPTELRLKAPSTKGLIVATALIGRPGEADAVKAHIETITCAPEPLPPQG